MGNLVETLLKSTGRRMDMSSPAHSRANMRKGRVRIDECTGRVGVVSRPA